MDGQAQKLEHNQAWACRAALLCGKPGIRRGPALGNHKFGERSSNSAVNDAGAGPPRATDGIRRQKPPHSGVETTRRPFAVWRRSKLFATRYRGKAMSE